jgi:hypothetical protein
LQIFTTSIAVRRNLLLWVLCTSTFSLALEEGLHELPRHQFHLVAEGKELKAQMMGVREGVPRSSARFWYLSAERGTSHRG